MIVVDNGSTDRGASIARQFADPHIRVIECFKRGPGAARKAGPRHADSDGVLFLDADDLIEPEHLASLLDIGARSGAEIVAGRWKEFRNTDPNHFEVKHPTGWN